MGTQKNKAKILYQRWSALKTNNDNPTASAEAAYDRAVYYANLPREEIDQERFLENSKASIVRSR